MRSRSHRSLRAARSGRRQIERSLPLLEIAGPDAEFTLRLRARLLAADGRPDVCAAFRRDRSRYCFR